MPASAISSGTIDSARLPFGASLWQDGGSSRIYYNAGYVGLGTTSPGVKLHVDGTGELLRMTSAGFGTIYMGTDINHPYIGTSTNHKLRFATNGFTRATIDEGGNVGIGTSSPGQKLEVSGNISSSADIYSATAGGWLSALLAAKQSSLGYSPVNKAGDTMTGQLVSTAGQAASTGIATATGGLGGFEARSQGSGGTAGAAMISFHRPGNYAAYFGLDTDNVFKVGGWSMGASAYTVWHSGNFDPNSKQNALGYTAANIAEVPSGNNAAAASDQVSDMNTLTQKSGFYFRDNPSNGPFGTWTTWMTAMGHYTGDRYGFQMAKNYWGDDFRVRGLTNNSWGSWRTLWHSGNFTPPNQTLDTTSGPTFDTIYTGNWFRSTGNSGWYNQTHNGGFYMSDSTWIRTHSDDGVWTGAGHLGSQGGLTVGYSGASAPSGGAIIAGNVGVGVSNPTARLDVAGEVKFGNTSSTCNSTTEGQQRYNSGSKKMEFCNGTAWTEFGTGGSSSKLVQSGDGYPAEVLGWPKAIRCYRAAINRYAIMRLSLVALDTGTVYYGMEPYGDTGSILYTLSTGNYNTFTGDDYTSGCTANVLTNTSVHVSQ